MKKIIISLIGAALCGASLSAQEIKPFKEGDRPVFLGNSITDGGHYHSYIWLYYMTRFPNMPITVFNGGIGGDTAYDENKRLDSDIFSKNPTVLMVTFGMNDSGYMEYNGDNAKEFGEQKYQESIRNFKNMEKRFKDLHNTRIVMVGTSPYDEGAQIDGNNFHGKNATIKRIIEYQKNSAAENGWEFIDFNAPMEEINRREQQVNPAFTLCGKDRIHPDNAGHMVMAYLYLKAQGFAGKCVADMDINARKMQVMKEDNCTVTNLKKAGKDISFDYLAEALPFPMDTVVRGDVAGQCQAMVKDIVPFMEEMNQERLTVTGLSGKYRLFIDDEEIGIWSGKELAKGINLAEISLTPQYQQALALMYLNERRWELERKFRIFAWCQNGFFQQYGLMNANDRNAIKVMNDNLGKNLWMTIQHGLYTDMMPDAVRKGMQAEMDALVNTIYENNKPVTRHFVLRKV